MRRHALSVVALAILGGMAVVGCPNVEVPGLVAPPGSAQGTAAGATACIPSLERPSPSVPWKDIDELCKAPRGKSWAGPDWSKGEEKAALEIREFLRSEAYKRAPYDWLHDADWRLTGEIEGCPPNLDSKGPHPAVRVYYSPDVIDWMCTYRRGPDELPGAKDMPDGAMIIKEMISPGRVQLAIDPGSNKLWIAPMPGKPADHYDQAFDMWTIMLKKRTLSADGFFWGYYDKTSEANPPFFDRAAFTKTPYPGQGGAKVDEPPGCEWLPTYWGYTVADQQYPNAQAGSYCVYCHASAQGETTFSSLKNLMGKEIEYAWSPGTGAEAPDAEDHPKGSKLRKKLAEAAQKSCPDNPFPQPRTEPLPGFRKAFPELDPTYGEVWDTRLPSHSYDHAESRIGVQGVPLQASEFLTSDQCEGCHEGGGSGQLAVPYMIEKEGSKQIDLTPWAEWSVSPMGLAGRDPVFHSQLELERNLARDEPGLANIRDCIDNTCLHCHGGPGARQYNIDTAGKGPAGDPCKDFLPPKDERRQTDYDGSLFTHRMVGAWRDEDPELARYGGLARDGINCTMCHRIAEKDLDPANLHKTFTGNFRVGPADELYGPFPNDASKEEVKPKPMQHALAITPEAGKQLLSSELCGTCHTVFLPVFGETGKLAGTAYEQTTYLEWLLSDFAGYPGKQASGKTCQDCHMPHEYNGKPIHTGIANVQDTRYPEADFLLPAKDIDVVERPYNRHKLYGLNVFLNAYAQQYPLLLGIRQQDYMNPFVAAPLLTGLQSALEVAAKETAEVTVSAPVWKGDVLEAQVTVRNLGGHSLPSGVGFRRLFLQVEVLGEGDELLWASGRTNDIGQILRGTTDEPLPTESFLAGPNGLPFEPHHQVVTSGDQVQIYEELTQTQAKEFSSSFLHRYWSIKDNRIRPRGYSPDRVPDAGLRKEYEEATRPGTGPERNWWPRPRPEKYVNRRYPAIESYTDTKSDPDYQLAAHPRNGLPGTDAVLYKVALPGGAKARAKRIRVTLYSQSTPPHFLHERFAEAAEKGAEKVAATRLYYMTGHLDTAATAGGRAYLAGFRLQVGAAVTQSIPSP